MAEFVDASVVPLQRRHRHARPPQDQATADQWLAIILFGEANRLKVRASTVAMEMLPHFLSSGNVVAGEGKYFRSILRIRRYIFLARANWRNLVGLSL